MHGFITMTLILFVASMVILGVAQFIQLIEESIHAHRNSGGRA